MDIIQTNFKTITTYPAVLDMIFRLYKAKIAVDIEYMTYPDEIITAHRIVQQCLYEQEPIQVTLKKQDDYYSLLFDFQTYSPLIIDDEIDFINYFLQCYEEYLIVPFQPKPVCEAKAAVPLNAIEKYLSSKYDIEVCMAKYFNLLDQNETIYTIPAPNYKHHIFTTQTLITNFLIDTYQLQVGDKVKIYKVVN